MPAQDARTAGLAVRGPAQYTGPAPDRVVERIARRPRGGGHGGGTPPGSKWDMRMATEAALRWSCFAPSRIRPITRVAEQ